MTHRVIEMANENKPSIQDLESRLQAMHDAETPEGTPEPTPEEPGQPGQPEEPDEPETPDVPEEHSEPNLEIPPTLEPEGDDEEDAQLAKNPLTADLVEAFKLQAEAAKARLEWEQRQVELAQHQQLAQAQQAQESDEWISREMGRIGLDPTNAHHVFMFQTARQQQKIQASYDAKIQQLEQAFQAREAQAQAQVAAQKVTETAKDMHPQVRTVLEAQVKSLVEQGVPADQAVAAVMGQPLLAALAQLQPNAAKKPGVKVAPQSQDPKRLAAMRAVAPQGKTAGRAQPKAAEMTREQRLERMKAFERGEFPR